MSWIELERLVGVVDEEFSSTERRQLERNIKTPVVMKALAMIKQTTEEKAKNLRHADPNDPAAIAALQSESRARDEVLEELFGLFEVEEEEYE